MKKKTKAKKPRTLNAVYADAVCSVGESGVRIVSIGVAPVRLSAAQALRLSRWLAEAAAWKGDE